MRHASWLGVLTVAASLMHAGTLEPKKVYELLEKGTSLSAKQAADLEEKLRRKPADAEARVELLSFYASRPGGVDIEAIKAARARHISWLIENDPKEGFGLFQVATGVYRLNCAGDELADPESSRRIGELWMQQMRKNPADAGIRRNAIAAIQYCAPEEAEKLLTEAADASALGRLYGAAVLGITGESYTSNDPSGSDATLRQSAFAARARHILEDSANADVVNGAATVLLKDGAILWADGKLDWDYTELGGKLLAKAKQLNPDAMMLLTLPAQLPARGERPPMTIRVGGNVQASQMVRKVTPPYPPIARDRGVQGTVRMTALIGLDGRILALNPTAGPTELIPAALDAVRQWVYKPTLLNGKPCYVITQIDVNFMLR